MAADILEEATPANNEKTFDFFGLPRELRDLIYVELYAPPRLLTSPDKYLRAVIRSGPVAKLFIISKQFCFEYKESLGKATILSVEDQVPCMMERDLMLSIPSVFLASTSHVELRLTMTRSCTCDEFDCDVPDEMDLHADWVSRLLASLPALSFLDVEVFADMDSTNVTSLHMYTAHMAWMTDAPKTSRITVSDGIPPKRRAEEPACDGEGEEPADTLDYDVARSIIATWKAGEWTYSATMEKDGRSC